MANADLIQRVWETTAPALQESLLALGITPHPLDLQTLECLLNACPVLEGTRDITSDALLLELQDRCVHTGGMVREAVLPHLERLARCIAIFPEWSRWAQAQQAAAQVLRSYESAVPISLKRKREDYLATPGSRPKGI